MRDMKDFVKSFYANIANFKMCEGDNNNDGENYQGVLMDKKQTALYV